MLAVDLWHPHVGQPVDSRHDFARARREDRLAVDTIGTHVGRLQALRAQPNGVNFDDIDGVGLAAPCMEAVYGGVECLKDARSRRFHCRH